MPSRTSIQVASYNSAPSLNTIEPASGYEPQTISLKNSCNNQCGTFSYFNEYREKARLKAKEEASSRHAALKRHMQNKHILHYPTIDYSGQPQNTPVRRRAIIDGANHKEPSFDYER